MNADNSRSAKCIWSVYNEFESDSLCVMMPSSPLHSKWSCIVVTGGLRRGESLTSLLHHSGHLRPVDASFRLVFDDPKSTRQIVVRTSCKKQLIRVSILGISSAEFDSPQLIDANWLPVEVLQRAHKLPGLDVEGINFSTVGVVGDEQRIAERAEIFRSDGETPRLSQWLAVNELADKSTVLFKYVHKAGRTAIGRGKRYVHQTVDVLKAEGCIT